MGLAVYSFGYCRVVNFVDNSRIFFVTRCAFDQNPSVTKHFYGDLKFIAKMLSKM